MLQFPYTVFKCFLHQQMSRSLVHAIKVIHSKVRLTCQKAKHVCCRTVSTFFFFVFLSICWSIFLAFQSLIFLSFQSRIDCTRICTLPKTFVFEFLQCCIMSRQPTMDRLETKKGDKRISHLK